MVGTTGFNKRKINFNKEKVGNHWQLMRFRALLLRP
jgi:hypothetical protein